MRQHCSWAITTLLLRGHRKGGVLDDGGDAHRTWVRGMSLNWTEVDRSKRGPEVDRNGTISIHFRSTSGPAEAGGRTKWTEVDR